MEDFQTLPRLLGDRVRKALGMFPVVVVGGARQTGKTTLTRALGEAEGRPYFSLDDFPTFDRAKREPRALVAEAPSMALDEVQRVPDLLRAVKLEVDERRRPGRFLLTGSANLLLMQRVSESLAGRAAYCSLWPMTRREILGRGTAGCWSDLLDRDPRRWPEHLRASDAPRDDWRACALRGGFPDPVLRASSPEDRGAWFEAYATTYLERDLRDITAIDSLVDYRDLMRAACLRVGGLLNQADLARDLHLPPVTVHRWLNLLEATYQVVRVRGFHRNRTLRLVKAPKVYWSDTGLALHLAGEHEPRGAHLENLVLLDLLAWASSRAVPPQILHWRTASGAEVDFVVEDRRRLLPVEVKSTSRPGVDDARGLEAFLASEPGRAPAGLLLHGGEEVGWLTDRVLAAPWWRVM